MADDKRDADRKAETDRKADADRRAENERRLADERKRTDERTNKTYDDQRRNQPTPSQEENDRGKRAAVHAQGSPEQQTIEERTAEFYEHDEPTPTQAENDAAKLGAMGSETPPPPEGETGESGITTARRNVEANRPGGYDTRASHAKE